jgi:3-ketoacyl-CoA synthase
MLIPNCLFRSNGSAVLLSNRPCDAGSAKYSIRHLVRTNLAADDVAFNCVLQTEDDEGKVRVAHAGVWVLTQ